MFSANLSAQLLFLLAYDAAGGSADVVLVMNTSGPLFGSGDVVTFDLFDLKFRTKAGKMTVILKTIEGLGVETAATAVVLGVLTLIIVALRVWVRTSNGAIGGDDYLMMVALLFFFPSCLFTHFSCLSGLGTPDHIIMEQDPSGEIYERGSKFFFAIQIAYFWCLPCIKTSICIALLRITKAKYFAIPIWSVMGLSIFASVVGFVAVLCQCRPITANWDISVGTCKGSDRVGKASIVVSVISILTDWLCAILPALLLWNLNMKPKLKALLTCVLALGALASISTCIRLRYIRVYNEDENEPGDNLRHGANLVVWSIVECGIGIIAGSLPSLQPLLRKYGFGVDHSLLLRLPPPSSGQPDPSDPAMHLLRLAEPTLTRTGNGGTVAVYMIMNRRAGSWLL
ncbi:hypothetical protein F5Y13DRAFT_185349 [Hypoxylon sp. FL1857]|nr:hypothetical protein F5Y13DRAFT_185349 [Hypoxylon sp. FL1857]